MIDLNAEYEKFLDNEATEFLNRITFRQIVEAIDCNINEPVTEAMLSVGVRGGDASKTTAFIALRKICYEYWRKVLAEKHAYDTWESERNADRAADKAEDAYELYETNRGG